LPPEYIDRVREYMPEIYNDYNDNLPLTLKLHPKNIDDEAKEMIKKGHTVKFKKNNKIEITIT